MRIIYDSLKPYLFKILLGTALSTASGFCVLLIIRSINTHIQSKLQDFDVEPFLLHFGIQLAAFVVFAILSTLILSRISNQVILDLRLLLSKKALNANFESLEFRKNELMMVLYSDVKTIGGVMNRIPGMISRFIIGIGGLSYLVYISWKLSFVILGIVFIIVLITHFTNKKLNIISLKTRKSTNVVYKAFVAIVHGIKELYSNPLHKQHYMERQLPEILKEEYDLTVDERLYSEISSKANEALLFASIGLLIILINVFGVVSKSVFIEFLTVSLFIINPLSTLANFTKSFSPFRAAIEAINDVGLTMLKDNNTPSQLNQDKLSGNINFKGIEFKYYNSDIDDFFNLGPLNFEIERNKITMIIGGNGSGKTTLAKVISGLYKPQKGTIEIGDKAPWIDNIDDYRNLFSTIFTDNHLFTDLGYIEPWDDVKANNLLEMLTLSHKIKFTGRKVPGDLSMGQQKRLAMIKALMENKEIFLFDEWAANQDPQFKKIFYSQIIPELKAQKKTVVLISHDDAYFDTADKIIHLREGKMYKQEKN